MPDLIYLRVSEDESMCGGRAGGIEMIFRLKCLARALGSFQSLA